MKAIYALLVKNQAASGLLVFVLLAILYAPSIDNAFQYDDRHSIVENPHIRMTSNIPSFFADPTLFSRDPDKAMYRPLVLVSLALNYAWSAQQPYSYHLVNTGIHILCSLFLWGILLRLGRPPCMALLGALLFALHPLCSEPVNYISSRSELLAGLGGLSMLWFYMWAAEEGGGGRWYLVSLLCFIGGLLSKSVALTAPLWLVAWDIQRGMRWRWKAYIPYGAIGLGYIWMVGTALERAMVSDPVRAFDEQMATQIKALVYYLYLLWSPTALSVDHAFNVSEFGDLAVWIAVALLLSLLWFLGRVRSSVLGWVIGLSALLPTLLVPLNVLVNEHRLYLPIAGMAVILSGLRGLERIPQIGWGAPFLLLLFSGLTLQRNAIWQDEWTLWQDAHQKNPRSVRPLVYMGNAQRERGSSNRALEAYAKALELEPHNAVVRAGMAGVFLDKGESGRAVQYYAQALKDEPLLLDLHYSLGRALQEANRLDEARFHYSQLSAESPHRGIALNNIGTTFEQQERPDSAVVYYRMAAGEGAIDGERNLGRLIERLVQLAEEALQAGDMASTELRSRQALLGAPEHPYARFFLCASLLQQGRVEESIAENERLVDQHTGFEEGWLQLANAYETAGYPRRAQSAYEHLLKEAQHPSMRELASARLEHLLERMGEMR